MLKYLTAEEFDLMTEDQINDWEEQKLMEELDRKAALLREKNKIVPLSPYHQKLAAMVSETANKQNYK